jgi:hypothetical protein
MVVRIFSTADVHTDRSIRFVLWNSEEGGLVGSGAYVEQRAALQGKEDPPGSGHRRGRGRTIGGRHRDEMRTAEHCMLTTAR